MSFSLLKRGLGLLILTPTNIMDMMQTYNNYQYVVYYLTLFNTLKPYMFISRINLLF